MINGIAVQKAYIAEASVKAGEGEECVLQASFRRVLIDLTGQAVLVLHKVHNATAYDQQHEQQQQQEKPRLCPCLERAMY